ncbi:hypothetical protein F5B22DRAFT_560747 [Xylaria bambusicola]|uniref:uncharacterized protein n=1 Tax=Xylaria bambusicola TaxID=326684 RepID=UPI0020087417|nr:uncharacterized protein F5B22DRAFT_560747 [Xylaria bambusicola]KAI0503226.1 hypothetical protein F5B22DRAFT_560747 [Xylaria bambusicola]
MLSARILRTSATLPSKRIFTSLSPSFQATMSSSTLPSPVPIVLIGIHTEIGRSVAEALRPDWDIVRFIQTYEAAQADLPYLLKGEAPPAAPTNSVGSGNYSQPARAVLFGRGFTQQQAETLYEQHADSATSPPVLWAAGAEANRKPLPAGIEVPPNVDKIVVPIFKGLLEDWKKKVEGEGKKEGELVLY